MSARRSSRIVAACCGGAVGGRIVHRNRRGAWSRSATEGERRQAAVALIRRNVLIDSVGSGAGARMPNRQVI